MSHTDLATQASTLGDRSYQKRETAAISIEMSIRQIMNTDPSDQTSSNYPSPKLSPSDLIYHRTDQIQKRIDFLFRNFIRSDQPNHRKGGLLGLTGVIMALTTKRNELTYEGIQFLNPIILVVDQWLEDEDWSVRYYACETLYNVIKVARHHIIPVFELIFNKIQMLCEDAEPNVRLANATINRLLQNIACSYDQFNVIPFISRLEGLMVSSSANVRELAVNWLSALDSEPDIYMLCHLPRFLPALFMMLIDPKARLRKMVESLMMSLLEELHDCLTRDQDLHEEERFDMEAIVTHLVTIIISSDSDLIRRREFIMSTDTSKLYSSAHAVSGTSPTRRDTSSKAGETSPIADESASAAAHGASPKPQLPSKESSLEASQSGSDSDSLQVDAILEHRFEELRNSGRNVDLPKPPHLSNSAIGEKSATDLSLMLSPNNSANDGTASLVHNASGDTPSVDTKKSTSEAQKIVKIVALEWLDVFIQLGGKQLSSLYPNILSAVLFAINDSRIRRQAEMLNEHLLDLLLSSKQESGGVSGDIMEHSLSEGVGAAAVADAAVTSKYSYFDIRAVMDVLIDVLQNESFVMSRMASLRWISQLLIDLPLEHIPIDRLLSVCFTRLRDNDEYVVTMAIQVLARILLIPQYFDHLLRNLLDIFRREYDLLQMRGRLVIQKLCLLIDAEKIFATIATLILEYLKSYPRFAEDLVRILNMILLSTEELHPLRESIKKCKSEDESCAIFSVLYKTWCVAPVATLSLCLLGQRYGLGAQLIEYFCCNFSENGSYHKSPKFLLEIDQLVHLIESPIFVHLRMQLLMNQQLNEPFSDVKWKQLFDIVSGMLTLLPMSDAYHQLRIRVEMVSLHTRLYATLSRRSAGFIESDQMFLQNYQRTTASVPNPPLITVPSQDSSNGKLFRLFLDMRQQMKEAGVE